jgi:hypothetical protein
MNILDLILTIIGVALWSWLMVGYAEWVDRYRDIDDARQDQMGRGAFLWMKFVAWLGQLTIPFGKAQIRLTRIVWAAGILAIVWLGFTHPEASSLAGMIWGGAYALRAPEDNDEPTDIQQLRTALGDIIKDPDHPPTVTLKGEHLEGGPTEAFIGGHPNFKEYTKAHRDALENAIEYRLEGDWEPVDWYGDGSSRWERVIHPPDEVDYPGHFDDLPGLTPPIGVDGLGNLAIMNLIDIAHWFIAAITRKGKTTILRDANIHLLRHKVPIIAFDVKGGLAYLRGREGVKAVYTQRIKHLEAGMRLLREEVEDRTDQFERDGTYREEMIAEVDELAVACDRAYALGPTGKDKGARYPRFITDLLEVIRLGGQVGVHVVIATQRPGADVIPIEIKEQCEGRITVGAVSQEVAQMMFESGWARAVNTPDKKGRIDMGHSSGEDCAWWQAFWTADPADEHHPLDARLRAEALLPPVVDVQIADVGNGTLDESDTTARIEDLSKRGPVGDNLRDGTPVVVGTGAVTSERGLLAMIEKAQRSKAANAQRTAKWRAGFQDALLDPASPKHGTRTAIREGCPLKCDKCTPKSVEVSS